MSISSQVSSSSQSTQCTKEELDRKVNVYLRISFVHFCVLIKHLRAEFLNLVIDIPALKTVTFCQLNSGDIVHVQYYSVPSNPSFKFNKNEAMLSLLEQEYQ